MTLGDEAGSGTIRVGGPARRRAEHDGRGLLFWYGATSISRAANSRRYRIENLIEYAPEAKSVVAKQFPETALDGVDTVIALRPYVDGATRRRLDELRRRGLRLVADYDDLLFDCPLSDFPPAERWMHRPGMARRLRIYAASLRHFDAFTASTAPIADALRRLRLDAPVTIVPNAPSPRWIERGRRGFGHLRWEPGAPKVLRYLPGSPSHDRDFEQIEPVLAAFLEEHSEVDLEIVGYLNFRRDRFPRGRVRHLRMVPYDALPAVLASSWVNLAPLAPTVYSQARSALKFLEAAAFWAPTVASPAPDFARHPSDVFCKAEGQHEWRTALERLLDDDQRMTLGARAAAYVDGLDLLTERDRAFAQAHGAGKSV